MLLMFNLHKVSALLKGSPSPPQAVHCMCKATLVAIRMVESGGAACRWGSACRPHILTAFFVLQTPISTLSL